MRYFTYIAEQSFKSDNEGHRLFYMGTPFSRPYLIPDEATEAQLFRKMTWIHRVFLPSIILGQPFLFRYYIRQPWLFYAFLASVIVVQWWRCGLSLMQAFARCIDLRLGCHFERFI